MLCVVIRTSTYRVCPLSCENQQFPASEVHHRHPNNGQLAYPYLHLPDNEDRPSIAIEVTSKRIDHLSSSNNINLESTLGTLRNTYKDKGAHLTGRLYDNATGDVVQEMLPSGEVTDYVYDGWSRLTAVKNDNAKTVREHQYSLGSNSNHILTKDMLNATASASSDVK